uniref:UPF0506 domain-containing protein n=1 Tax=Trichobilharzia regenti TaxID=157069 RepID=A0AA85J277_TRIRE|nr:unnamed protein product [Trichobilharzia regenti]
MYINTPVDALQCRKLNESCSKTVFSRCCDNLVCKMGGVNKCVKCLDFGDTCIKSSECCHGKCRLFACKNIK